MTTITSPRAERVHQTADPYVRNNALKVATIGGIQIFVHWTWLLAFLFFTWSLGAYYDTTFHGWGHGTAYLLGALSTILLFVTVLLHELGHSFTARALGLPVNSITLFIFGGVSNLTNEPQSPRVEFLVAFAGPLTSLLLSGIFYLLHAAAGSGSSEISAVLGYLASVNLILAIFNLIPAFPLDGGRVFRSIVWAIRGSMRQATRVATSVSRVIAYLFIAAGLVEALIGGNLVGGIWLAFIGWFLYNSASASGQQAVMDQMLQGVDVRDVMDPAPAGIAPSTRVQSLVFDHLLDQGRRAAAVQSPDGTLLGLVTLSDLRHLPQEDWSSTPVSQIMTPTARLATVAPSTDLRQAVGFLATNQFHQLPVIEQGRLVGLLTRDHVIQFLQQRQTQSRQEESRQAGDKVRVFPNRGDSWKDQRY
jgi:Zn-dependent protease/predicted transcriptional regulator